MKKLFMIVFFCSTVKYSISQIINRVPNISTASLSTAVVLNNKLYIIGVLQGTNHLQVFCIDPTQSGSSMVTAITNSSNSYNNGFSQLVTFNNKLFITAQRVIPGNPQNTDLYVSDGTANGTHLFDGFPIDYFSFTSIPSDYLVYKNLLKKMINIRFNSLQSRSNNCIY